MAAASEPPRRGRSDAGGAWTLVHAGFEFAAVTAVLALLGWWLDGKWGTEPWLLVIGLAIGLIGGLYKLWKTGKRFFAEN